LPVAEASQAITAGSSDDADPAVAALVVLNQLVCTGVLVAPRVVLTAGHCIATLRIRGATAVFGRSPDAGTPMRITYAEEHPAFDPSSLANDLGVVLLERDALDAPVALPPHTLDGSLEGTTLRLVGFGRGGSGDDARPMKRQGTTTIARASRATFTFEPHPSQTCEGDSGGPAFMSLDGKQVLLGIASFGDAQCASFGTHTRVDAYMTAYLEPLLRAASRRDAVEADRCYDAANCRSGQCLAATDGSHARQCGAAATPEGGCALGMPADHSSRGESAAPWIVGIVVLLVQARRARTRRHFVRPSRTTR
jgi:secreted trypsin-like serine protease